MATRDKSQGHAFSYPTAKKEIVFQKPKPKPKKSPSEEDAAADKDLLEQYEKFRYGKD